MRIAVGRWYFAAVVSLPGLPPACIGFGLPGSATKARRVAEEMAVTL